MKADCEVVEAPFSRLVEYCAIPIRFEVRSVFWVEGDDPVSAILTEVPVERPWTKDYDTIEGQQPTRWATRWDLANWGLLAAYVGGREIGVCVLAHNTGGIELLEERSDVVAVWDIRVHPDYRRNGIGDRLFGAAVHWARSRQCHKLKVETQNINVPACRFYMRQGCRLSSINRRAYDALPDEIQLIWSLAL
jgi:GNAT superfamily N-acetyltransferase